MDQINTNPPSTVQFEEGVFKTEVLKIYESCKFSNPNNIEEDINEHLFKLDNLSMDNPSPQTWKDLSLAYFFLYEKENKFSWLEKAYKYSHVASMISTDITFRQQFSVRYLRVLWDDYKNKHDLRKAISSMMLQSPNQFVFDTIQTQRMYRMSIGLQGGRFEDIFNLLNPSDNNPVQTVLKDSKIN